MPRCAWFSLATIVSVAAGARADGLSFTEQAAARGVEYVVTDGSFGIGQFGCGVALVDLDNDGDDDIVATGAASAQIALFRNDGRGRFTDATAGSGLPIAAKASGIVAGDYDGDGDLDLFITRWLAPALLMRNEGNLLFANATATALLAGISGAGAGSSFGDYDADGDLDLAVAMRTGTSLNQMRNRLYRNNGNGTFTEVAAALGVDDAWASFQCILQDLDRDGDCDLYVSNDKGQAGNSWNRLFRNDGGAFTEDLASGACISIDSMGVSAGDLDMNGLVDIFCTNVATGHALLLADDPLRFTRSEAKAGVQGATTGWGALIFDADNDRDQDLFACSMTGAPDYLWLNEGGFPLAERSTRCGIGDDLDSYCLASGDIDGDGDVDLLMQSQFANLRLYVNEAPAGNRSVALRVVGVGKNRFAVGALVDVEVAGSVALREVIAGSCYKSQSSMIVHAGLGDRAVADRVTVRWPRVGDVREERVLVNVPSGWTVPVYPPSRLGDAQGDGRVDPADLAACEACVGAPFAAACAVFDFDGDFAVGSADRAATELRMLDLNRDGSVNSPDIAYLLAGWLRPDLDLTGDAVVNSADLARLLAGWSR